MITSLPHDEGYIHTKKDGNVIALVRVSRDEAYPAILRQACLSAHTARSSDVGHLKHMSVLLSAKGHPARWDGLDVVKAVVGGGREEITPVCSWALAG